jgi:hypothetical protein
VVVEIPGQHLNIGIIVEIERFAIETVARADLTLGALCINNAGIDSQDAKTSIGARSYQKN